MVSIKKNFYYNSILTISGYLFPILTFPYVTRVLGVSNIGIYNFVDSIIQYFTMLSMLGITTIGIREIAKHKSNKSDLSRVFSSLFTLNLITTSLAILVLIVSSFFISRLYEYQEMIYIGCARLLFNALLIEWLYKGIENFKYITYRSICIRLLYVVSIFVFVREENDYVVYFGITALLVVLNALINLNYSRNYVKFSFEKITLKPYVKPLLTLGLYQILTSMYTSFNVMYLGFTCGELQVGYYSTSVKLYTIILSFFTAFTGVMLPRMSTLIGEGKLDEFKEMTSKSINLLLAFVMPLIVICEVYSSDIIYILAGYGYEGAIVPMRLVIPLIFIIGYEQILIIQILSPMRKDKSILINSVWGASIAILSNLIFVKKLGATGSSIVWLLAEITVLISAQYYVSKYIKYKFPVREIMREVFYLIPILLLNIICYKIINIPFLSLFIGILITGIYYTIVICFIHKNTVINTNINKLLKKCDIQYQLP